LDQLSVAQRFVQDLSQLRQRAGRPSYSTLERLSGHELRRATMSDVLNGNRVNLPDWRFVAEFVGACRAAAEESGLDANDLGTVADWKRHWDGASSGVIDARFPGHGYQSFAVKEPIKDPAAVARTESRKAASRSPGGPGDHLDAAAGGHVQAGPSVWGPVPPRLPDFTGREAWLENLRNVLVKDDRAGVVAIQGLSGVGKTQLVVEYAHRHSDEYDLVWWVPCDDAESAHGAIADLTARLGLADVAQRLDECDHAELFDMLRRGQPHARWLLVFDNANDPETIKDVIPPMSGHVLVTTRSSQWEASGDLLELDVFERAESIEFLRRRMRKFSAASAHRLAEGVGDLPLLLEHAVESRISVDTYLARLDADPFGILDDQPADYHSSIASVWRTALDELGAEASDALDLLRCLAYFGSDPVPRESLERGSYIAEVSIRAMLRDPFRRIGAIKKLRRAGLLRIGAGTGNFEVHQITRCAVRDMVAGSGAAAEKRARHDVHLLLAASDPLSPDDPATWRSYDELRGHAAESGIMSCSHEMVRKFVVNLARFLNAAGDSRAALDIADRALAHWNADGGEGSARAVDSHLTMRMARADALFACGRHGEAFRLRREVLTVMRSDPPKWAAEIVCLDGLSGEFLRMTGKFEEARAADEESVRVYVREFGRDDPRAFTAVNSLIADLALAGSGAEAARAADRVYRDCRAFYSDAAHPTVLAQRNVFGRCLWLSGQYGEAVSVFGEVRTGYSALAGGGVIDENHPWRLMHEIDYAIARRDNGLTPADVHVLADGMQDVRRRCWRMLGADHPQTLAATVVLGSVFRRAGGGAGEAARLLRDAERRYRSTLPDHPYGFACTGFLAAVRYHSAHGSPQQAAKSIPVIQDVIKRLTESVGEHHPLTLTAISALANTLARAGELDAAARGAPEALAGFQARLGPEHPHALAFEANTAMIRSRLGHEPASADLHARYAAALGPGHHDLELFARGQLIDIDFTPLPL
jgi:tetratricopeptide (TPR) repeat protein